MSNALRGPDEQPFRGWRLEERWRRLHRRDGDILGEIALGAEGPRSATVTPTEPSLLLVVGHRDFHALMDEMPTVRLKVLESLARRHESSFHGDPACAFDREPLTGAGCVSGPPLSPLRDGAVWRVQHSWGTTLRAAVGCPASAFLLVAPHFVINPRSDTTFVATVEGRADGAASPEALQERLRVLYPKAVVRPRQLAGERSEIWYVYRDGHWVPST